MNMKKNLKYIISCLTSLALAVSLTACSGSSSSTATEAPVAEEKDSGSGESDGGSASVDVDRGSEFVTIATDPTSGIYYPIGGAFATALGNAGYKTSAQATGASVENINLITNDEAELAIAMQDSHEGAGLSSK